jgi:predicted RNA-binding Zn-ribbon protein involved in translation (DUF1610 family)
MVEYITTKIPVPVYEQIEMTRSKLAMDKSTLKKLPPELLKPTSCPVCGSPMREAEVSVRARVGYYACTHCDYKQPIINVEAMSRGLNGLMALGSGIIIGLGMAALLYLLFGSEKK